MSGAAPSMGGNNPWMKLMGIVQHKDRSRHHSDGINHRQSSVLGSPIFSGLSGWTVQAVPASSITSTSQQSAECVITTGEQRQGGQPVLVSTEE
ncbi:hypothetical protein FJT64_014207 [Amphibalanus amphitrite]|uniref:Uncharacterized protein n=1 Tax=Amphibalanus amphitrite TaxID=1232801 RepID=A0A6A4V854_AMPAM|nr:hypothetical protein FJT64_014207 [Amphibalanus amphitrite]